MSMNDISIETEQKIRHDIFRFVQTNSKTGNYINPENLKNIFIKVCKEYINGISDFEIMDLFKNAIKKDGFLRIPFKTSLYYLKKQYSEFKLMYATSNNSMVKKYIQEFESKKLDINDYGFKHVIENDYDENGHKFTAYKFLDDNEFLLYKTTYQGMSFFKFKVLNSEYASQKTYTDFQISDNAS